MNETQWFRSLRIAQIRKILPMYEGDSRVLDSFEQERFFMATGELWAAYRRSADMHDATIAADLRAELHRLLAIE